MVGFEAASRLYTIEVDERGSGLCKTCTEDLISRTPLGEEWRARFEGAHEVVAVEVS